jgi:hypothetical protein
MDETFTSSTSKAIVGSETGKTDDLGASTSSGPLGSSFSTSGPDGNRSEAFLMSGGQKQTTPVCAKRFQSVVEAEDVAAQTDFGAERS